MNWVQYVLEPTMSLVEYNGKIIKSICSYLPLRKKTYWLTVYTHNEPDLSRVTALLLGQFPLIDENDKLGPHVDVHSGNDGFQDSAPYLKTNKYGEHKHYRLGDEGNFQTAVVALSTLWI
jgi:hypothetical protein